MLGLFCDIPKNAPLYQVRSFYPSSPLLFSTDFFHVRYKILQKAWSSLFYNYYCLLIIFKYTAKKRLVEVLLIAAANRRHRGILKFIEQEEVCFSLSAENSIQL